MFGHHNTHTHTKDRKSLQQLESDQISLLAYWNFRGTGVIRLFLGTWCESNRRNEKTNSMYHTNIFMYVLFTVHTNKKLLWRLQIFFTPHKILALHLFDLNFIGGLFCARSFFVVVVFVNLIYLVRNTHI